MTRRPGLSLTEVLVALFIMGIGTIAILTLFPLGALNMAQALRDDRTTQAAGQADAFLRWYVQEAKTTTVTARRLTNETWYKALNDPGSTGATTATTYLIPTTGQPIPSYPVVIDPMGFIARGSGGIRALWVGDNGFGNGDRANFPNAPANTTALSRHTFLLVDDQPKVPRTPIDTRPAFTQRICTLLDGMGYDKTTGAPDTQGGTAPIDRDIRYNWLWVLQNPDCSSPLPTATMTVVVFDRRAPMYAPAGSEEVFTPSYARPRETRVSFAAGQVPPVQKGGWLMDATVVAADATGRNFYVPSAGDSGTPPAGTIPWIRNANFYRVASVTEDPGTGGVDVELEVALKDDATPQVTGALVPLPEQFRRFVYLNGVAEVFVRKHQLDLN